MGKPWSCQQPPHMDDRSQDGRLGDEGRAGALLGAAGGRLGLVLALKSEVRGRESAW